MKLYLYERSVVHLNHLILPIAENTPIRYRFAYLTPENANALHSGRETFSSIEDAIAAGKAAVDERLEHEAAGRLLAKEFQEQGISRIFRPVAAVIGQIFSVTADLETGDINIEIPTIELADLLIDDSLALASLGRKLSAPHMNLLVEKAIVGRLPPEMYFRWQEMKGEQAND